MSNCKNTCEFCFKFRVKSDNFGICDNPKNQTKAMSIGLIQKMTGCDEDIAFEINESVRFPKDFGCIFFEPYPKE